MALRAACSRCSLVLAGVDDAHRARATIDFDELAVAKPVPTTAGRPCSRDESKSYELWFSEFGTRVWKRDAVTGETTTVVVANSEVHQLLWTPDS